MSIFQNVEVSIYTVVLIGCRCIMLFYWNWMEIPSLLKIIHPWLLQNLPNLIKKQTNNSPNTFHILSWDSFPNQSTPHESTWNAQVHLLTSNLSPAKFRQKSSKPPFLFVKTRRKTKKTAQKWACKFDFWKVSDDHLSTMSVGCGGCDYFYTPQQFLQVPSFGFEAFSGVLCGRFVLCTVFFKVPKSNQSSYQVAMHVMYLGKHL